MADTFDVIVAGSGPAGGHVARRCKRAGLSVAVVEENGWGGVCPLRGCEPKKTLVEAAHAVDAIHRMRGNGVTGQASIDWGDLIRFKREFTEPISDAVKKGLENADIATYSGHLEFTGPDEMLVHEASGSTVALQGRRVCLAVGAKPRPFSFPGADMMVASPEFLELESLPRRIVFLGGGYVSFEFTLVAMAAGCEAVLATHGNTFLRAFDQELVARLLDICREKGLELVTNFTPGNLERKDGKLVLHGAGDDARSFEADMIFNGAGRVPRTAALGLDKAGVTLVKGAVEVDDCMRSTSNKAVFAAGDCNNQSWPLTPVAVHQADVAVYNILQDLGIEYPTGREKVHYAGLASALFSDPPLGRAGMLEHEAAEQARKEGFSLKSYKGDASEWAEYRRIGRNHAGYNVLVREDTGHILGAHFLGEGAEEIVSLLGLAIRQGITVDDLMDMLWAYPSFAYTLRYVFG